MKNFIHSKNMILLIVLLATFTSSLFGTYHSYIPHTLMQPDNKTEVRAYWSGDEFHHVLHDENGYTMVRNPKDGWLCWAEHDKVADEIISTGYRVNEYIPGMLGIEKGVNISEEKYQSIRQPYDEVFEQHTVRTPATGEVNSIVIFINFAVDDSCATHGPIDNCRNCVGARDFEHSYEFYKEFLNGPASGSSDPDESLKQYIKEISYHNLTLNSHIITDNTDPNNIVFAYRAVHPSDYYRPYDDALRPRNLIGYLDRTERDARCFELFYSALEWVSDHIDPSIDVDL
ncbi:MAG: hypothetical protein FWG20_05485, partial [Candidatus Cloacimonetes bacterium]|nr:hypothetical protein [Candidatus Cloacimonadota bacterium]